MKDACRWQKVACRKNIVSELELRVSLRIMNSYFCKVQNIAGIVFYPHVKENHFTDFNSPDGKFI